MAAGIVFPGGSIAAAERILFTAVGLIRAGGLGVFIDNSALAHGGSDWLELAENCRDPQTLFYAFVTIVKSRTELRSHGMQVFGEPDAVIAHRSGLASALLSLEEFLRSRCRVQQPPDESDAFTDEQGKQYRLRHGPDVSPFRNHPLINPYGRWRMEPP